MANNSVSYAARLAFLDTQPLTANVAREIMDIMAIQGYFNNFERISSEDKKRALQQNWKKKGYKNTAGGIDKMMKSYRATFGSFKGVKSCIRSYLGQHQVVMDEGLAQAVLSSIKGGKNDR